MDLLVLPEDEHGVPGAPLDESRFEFDPDPESPPVMPLLDGIPTIPEGVREGLAPYLAAQHVRLSGTLPTREGTAFLVLARAGEVTQAHLVFEPGGRWVTITDEPEPLVQVAGLAGDESAILFRRGAGGDERRQLVRLELASRRRTLLTDGTRRHGRFSISSVDRRVAYTSTAPDSAELEILVGDGVTPDETRVIAQSRGSWVVGQWSPAGRWFLARQYLSSEDSRLFMVDSKTGDMTRLAPVDGRATCHGGVFSPDGQTLYYMSDEGREFLELVALDFASGHRVSLSHDIPWDVEHVSATNERVAFTTNENGFDAVHLLDVRTHARRRLDDIPEGVVGALWLRKGGEQLAVQLATATSPDDAFTYDVGDGTLRRWTDSSPEERVRRVDPETVAVRSFDGVDVPAFVFRPGGDGPFPVVIWMHGGPDSQFRPTYHPFIQYLVSRRIAVVAPNVRGSSGYGRTFRGLDNGRRRLDAVADVGALLDWIAGHPDFDADRVAIHGASYGGFIVLAAMVHYADRILAGSDHVGVSNLVTFLEGTAAYRQEHRRGEYGDERDKDMRAHLLEMSPLTHVDRIRGALFVSHGANDPRVPAAQAKQLVDAVRKTGGEVWYMLASDEGHGFRRRHTRDLYYAALAHFLAIHLRPEDRSPSP